MRKKTWPREHRYRGREYEGPSDAAQLAHDLFRCARQDQARGHHRSWKIDLFKKFTPDKTKLLVNNLGVSIFRASQLSWRPQVPAATCSMILLGEGQVVYRQEFEDSEFHLISVPFCMKGVNEVKLVTFAPAMSKEIVNNLYGAPHDVLSRVLHYFYVDCEDKGHVEKVDALVGVLDDSERRHGGQLTAICEAELMADSDAASAAPSFSRLAQKSVGFRRVLTG